MNPAQYSVYTVMLDKKVWLDKKFRDANPGIKPFAKPGAYIGATGKDINERFKDHKAGIKHNKYVKDFGKSVALIANCSTWAEANKREIEAACNLRRQGIGVFQK